jgi:hypothetical protein
VGYTESVRPTWLQLSRSHMASMSPVMTKVSLALCTEMVVSSVLGSVLWNSAARFGSLNLQMTEISPMGHLPLKRPRAVPLIPIDHDCLQYHHCYHGVSSSPGKRASPWEEIIDVLIHHGALELALAHRGPRQGQILP